MSKPRQPDPEVLESDYRVPTALGTAAWTVALVVLVAMGDRLPHSEEWWIWTCVTGIGLGLFAFLYIPRLLRKRAEADERHAPPADPAEQEPRADPSGGQRHAAGPVSDSGD